MNESIDNKNNSINNNISHEFESWHSEFEDNIPELIPKYEPREYNCLFYSLCYLIFQNFKYHVNITFIQIFLFFTID